jgi:TolB-like protein/thioredoxin-like negative regulator of GroEL
MENISGDSQQDYFADGMTDALITDLGRVGALRVISRTSVVGYKKTNKTLPEIGRELNVDAIVEGTVLRSGDRVRITAQLLHAPTDRHLWAQSYERDVRDVLGLQGEVARSIAMEVMAELTPQAQERLARSQAIQPEAYEDYLKGAFGGSAQQAIGPLQNSIKLQPDYAPAYASLASRYYSLGLFGSMSPSEAYPRMKDASLAALEKDGGLSEAYAALGLVRLHYDWNWGEAEKNFRRAIELNPNLADAHHGYAHYLLAMGRLKESVAETRKAVDLDPMNAGLVACLGWHELYTNQYDQTIEQALKAIRLNPENFWPHLVLGWGYEQEGQYDLAIPAFQKAVALSRGRAITAAALGHAFAVSDKRREAEEVLALLQEQMSQTYVPAYDVATIYVGWGDRDRTFQWLDRAFQEHSSYLIHVGWDPRFKLLRSDPRFGKLLQQIGLPQS